MALVAAAVCPHPPVLVPAIAVGAADELSELRTQCREAVRTLVDAGPDRVFVVGADLGLRATGFDAWAAGAFDLPRLDIPEPLPLPLLTGAWLTMGMPRSFVGVDPALDATDAVEIGRDLADAATRVVLLVMGDGSARHTLKAPGYLDPRAESYDDELRRAFASADLDALLRLDQQLSDELLVAGRVSWQVLAGAATGRGIDVKSTSYVAPYGVGYHVATWLANDG